MTARCAILSMNTSAGTGTRGRCLRTLLLQALTGVRYDAVSKALYVDSRVGDFVSLISTDKGFGNVVYKEGKVRVEVVYGEMDVRKVVVVERLRPLGKERSTLKYRGNTVRYPMETQ